MWQETLLFSLYAVNLLHDSRLWPRGELRSVRNQANHDCVCVQFTLKQDPGVS